jgi:Glycosyl hydrolase family 63 N-terminal domain
MKVNTLLLPLLALGTVHALDDLYADPDVALFSEKYNNTMEWGTYKPNQFFAIKDRSPNPVTVGMLWAVPKGREGLQVRHTMRYQSGDGVTAYYEYHDGWGASR